MLTPEDIADIRAKLARQSDVARATTDRNRVLRERLLARSAPTVR